jgi:hypothetical protein
VFETVEVMTQMTQTYTQVVIALFPMFSVRFTFTKLSFTAAANFPKPYNSELQALPQPISTKHNELHSKSNLRISEPNYFACSVTEESYIC